MPEVILPPCGPWKAPARAGQTGSSAWNEVFEERLAACEGYDLAAEISTLLKYDNINNFDNRESGRDRGTIQLNAALNHRPSGLKNLEIAMIRSTLAFASIVLALAIVPAQAQMAPMSCTTADMAKMSDDATKMTDTTKKAEVMKEMTMAKDMMGKKDEKACMTHMNNAAKMMPNKT